MERVRAGDRFVLTEDLATHGLTHWRAPATFGFDAELPRGTVVVADQDQAPGAPGFYCVPEQYKELEAALVPERDRKDPKYDGYSFVLDSADIGTRLRRAAN